MNDDVAEQLLGWIAENLCVESVFLTPRPQANVGVIPLLDKIADMRGLDRDVNGLEFDLLCDARDKRNGVDRVTISVTQEDIDNGVRRDCSKCPIARAIQREFPGKLVESGYTTAVIDEETYDFYAGGFVFRFDQGLTVVPFAFEMVKR